MPRLRFRTPLRAVGLLTACLALSIGCSDDDPAGPGGGEGCIPVDSTSEPDQILLHVVNITNTPEINVQATIGTRTCGPVALPVDNTGGLELALLVLPAEIGQTVTVFAERTTPGSQSSGIVSCVITEAARVPPEVATRLQAFVDLTFGTPITMTCEDGLAAAGS